MTLASENYRSGQPSSEYIQNNLAPHFSPDLINPQHFCHSARRKPVRLSKSGNNRFGQGANWVSQRHRPVKSTRIRNGSMIAEQSQSDEFPPQSVGRRKMNAVDAEPPGGLGVRRVVIDIDGVLWIDGETRKHQSINARVRFDRPDFARHENPAKPTKEFKTLERQGIGFGRPVRETIEGCAAVAQLGEDLDRAGDRSRYHLVKAGMIGVDQFGLVGMLSFEQASTFSEAAAGVLSSVPLIGADIREKMLHRCLVIAEELEVEMSRIPIDQHTAEIEHHDVSDRLCHRPAAEFRTRLDDSKRHWVQLGSATRPA